MTGEPRRVLQAIHGLWPAASGVSLCAAVCLSCLVPVAHDASAAQGRPGLEEPLISQPSRETTADKPPRVFLELRLAENEPVRGLAFEAAVKKSQKKIYLHYTTIATHVDVRKATIVESGGRYDVAVTLDASSAARVASATARHVGRPVAVILDGEVVSVVMVRKALGPEVVFSGDFTREEATRIAAGLERW